MEICGESLDEILIKLYKSILESPLKNKGTRGETAELLGLALRMTKPRARISRSENRGKPFSALGELLWYLSGSEKLEFIEPYVSKYREDADNGILYGAYGPRLFGMRGKIDQLKNVTDLLNNQPTSRRAVIQIFNAEDIERTYKEIPCTTTMQFHLRNSALHLSVTMRSNDAYWGLPHDIFCFTMIQEMMARRLGVELGEYYHYAGTMHVYLEYIDSLNKYLKEGHQKIVEMPPMPDGDPFLLVDNLLKAENQIRHCKPVNVSGILDAPYWADIIRLLQVFWATNSERGLNQLGQEEHLDQLEKEFSNPIYRSYVQNRRQSKLKAS